MVEFQIAPLRPLAYRYIRVNEDIDDYKPPA